MRISDWSSDVCSSDRVGAYREVQMVAVRLCTDGARGRDRLDRFGLDQPERSRQRREGVGERLGDLRQPVEIGGAAVDRDPGRTEERGVGKECGSTCISLCAPYA